MQQPVQPHMLPDLKAYTHDDIPAQETWLDCATADGGRLRVVLLAADRQAAVPLLARTQAVACRRRLPTLSSYSIRGSSKGRDASLGSSLPEQT